MKKNIHFSILLIFLLLLSVNVNEINNASGLFHLPNDQTTRFDDIEEKSKHFIESVDKQVNNLSSQFYRLGLAQEGSPDNKTIIEETNKYITNLSKIVERVDNFSPSEEYNSLFQAYSNSLKNEIESYKHYIKYIETSNITENEISLDLLSKAYEYETQAHKNLK